MLHRLTINPAAPAEPGLDQAALHAEGIEHVRRLSRRIWTDHNTHDPGVTTLSLLCYALTDLGYRASFPIEDLLSSAEGPEAMAAQFFTARTILPSRPVTVLDVRKLLIDVPGVRNAFVEPVPHKLYVDTVAGKLATTPPAHPGVREVALRGLHRARLDLTDETLKDAGKTSAALAEARARLAGSRCLCEDFLDPVVVEAQVFALCGDLELAPDADVVEVLGQVRLRVQAYLSPAVPNHTLSEMLARRKPDGSLYTVAEIFAGPALRTGFIDDDELAEAEIRTEIRLSDVIRVIMGIDGVRAVRDLLVTPAGQAAPLPSKWLVKVDGGKRPTLDDGSLRLVAYKRGMPFRPPAGDVNARYEALSLATAPKNETDVLADLPVPPGKVRSTGRYHAFQNHFPAIYGLGADGLPGSADERRRALAYQLKGYLLFFDQIMADYCAQLHRVKDLFALDATVRQTYFHQAVDSFAGWDRVYGRSDLGPESATVADIAAILGEAAGPAGAAQAADVERKNRFLDHLIARFAERFHDYVAVTATSLHATPESMIDVKSAFLQGYPALSAGRGHGYDSASTDPAEIWKTTNVSGLEKRLAGLLGLPTAMRHDLGSENEEGMFLLENILLRRGLFEAPLLPICADPTCVDCADDDPYSYRIHVILPAYAGRFVEMDFRRFVEEVIREETPAHVMPKICWLDRATMQTVEAAYHGWLSARAAGAGEAPALEALIEELYKAKSVYPKGLLHGCGPGEGTPKFQIGRSRLGSEDSGGE